ncbi:hypothetical protein KAH55_13010 [bacterium]|nr:hypothetical protein [bacterium]
MKQLEVALKAKPDHKDAQYYHALSQGALLYLRGSKTQLWDAISEFGTAMTLRPDSGEPHYFMGMAYEKKNRNEFDNAIEEYQTAIQKEPEGWFVKSSQQKIKKLSKTRNVLRKFWGE